jgi:hypothetical protein
MLFGLFSSQIYPCTRIDFIAGFRLLNATMEIAGNFCILLEVPFLEYILIYFQRNASKTAKPRIDLVTVCPC